MNELQAQAVPENPIGMFGLRIGVSINGTDYYDLTTTEIAMIFNQVQINNSLQRIKEMARLINDKTKLEHIQITYKHA